MAVRDLTDQTFGRLTACEIVGYDAHRQSIWACICACGNPEIVRVLRGNLIRLHTQSCGCLKIERVIQRNRQHIRHGFSRAGWVTPEYAAYHNAKYRCTNPQAGNFTDYGGRGIKFLFESFEQFIEHIGRKPSPELELDRIDNNGHYETGNVRWADRSTQINNRRSWKWARRKAA